MGEKVMSFSAYNGTNEKIYSYRLSDEEWNELESKKNKTDLKLPCCDSPAVCVSRNGVRYFDHAKNSQCKLKHSSNLNHIKNTYQIIESLLLGGWNVQTETMITDEYFAEIFATKNKLKLVIVLDYDRELSDGEYKVKTQEEIKETTKRLLEECETKVLWLVEFNQIATDEELEDVVKAYNEHSSVFALKRKGKQLNVFGLNKPYIRNKFRILGGMGELKLNIFADEFFVKKRVLRRSIKPDSYKVYYEFVEEKCPNPNCRIKTVGLTYVSVFCEFDDQREPRTMLIGKFWYTKAHVEEAHAVVNQDLEEKKCTTRLLYNTFHDDVKGGQVTKLRQYCTNCKGWFGIIATGITFKHKYHSKPLALNAKINHKDIAKGLSGGIWLLND